MTNRIFIKTIETCSNIERVVGVSDTPVVDLIEFDEGIKLQVDNKPVVEINDTDVEKYRKCMQHRFDFLSSRMPGGGLIDMREACYTCRLDCNKRIEELEMYLENPREYYLTTIGR